VCKLPRKLNRARSGAFSLARVNLIVNVGDSDVQFVSGEGDDRRRQLVDKSSVRTVHELLLDPDVRWQFDDEPLAEKRERLERHEIPSSSDEAPWLLCTPKVDSALSWIADQGHTLVGGLVFATRRDDASSFPEEPIAAGHVLTERIRSWKHAPKSVDVSCVSYLEKDETLEGEGADKDVRQAAIRRIDRAVQQFAPKDASERDNLIVVLEVVGGITRVGELIQAAVRRHFVGVTLVNIVPPLKGGAAKAGDLPGPTAAESYRRRAQIDRLLARGDIAAVRGALSGQEAGPAWSASLLAACEVLDGKPSRLSDVTGPLWRKLATVAESPSLMVAFRVETALRGGRVLDALIWMGTLIDVAEIDALSRLEGVRYDAEADLCTISNLDPMWTSERGDKSPVFRRRGRRYKPNTGPYLDGLLSYLEQRGSPTAAALKVLIASWNKGPKSRRNAAVHTPTKVGSPDDVVGLLVSKNIWAAAQIDGEQVVSLLRAPLVEGLMKTFDIVDPFRTFQDVIKTARACVWGET
jgi:hypothetical protein